MVSLRVLDATDGGDSEKGLVPSVQVKHDSRAAAEALSAGSGLRRWDSWLRVRWCLLALPRCGSFPCLRSVPEAKALLSLAGALQFEVLREYREASG